MIIRENISFERGRNPADSMRIGRKRRFVGMTSEGVAQLMLDTVHDDIQIDSLLRQGEYALRKYDLEDWDDYFDMIDTGEDGIKALDDILIKLEEQIDQILSENHFPITQGKEGNVHGIIFSALTQGGARGNIIYSIEGFIDDSYLAESVNFQKGLDPREMMDIGDEAYRVLQKMKTIAASLGIPEIPIDDLNKEKALASWRMPGIKGTDQERKDTGIGRIILYKSGDDEIKVYTKGIRGTDIDQWYSWNSPRKWIENIKMINEDVNFERGRDPKDTMKIGSKELLKDDSLGRQRGWTWEEKKRPSQLLGLDVDDIYILGFAGEVDYGEWHFNDYTGMLYDICSKGRSLKREVYGKNTYTLKDTSAGKIVMAQLDEEGMYFYGGLEAALYLDLPEVPQSERESIF